MLQPAATSSQSSLSLAVAAPGGATESAEIPEGFAALLAGGMPTEAAAEVDPEALLAAATAALRQAGKPTGNASGKVLPDMLPESEAVALPGEPGGEDEAGDELPRSTEILTEPTLAMLALTLPLPAASANVVQTEAETTAKAGTNLSQQVATAALARADQAAATTVKAGEQQAVPTEAETIAVPLPVRAPEARPDRTGKPAAVTSKVRPIQLGATDIAKTQQSMQPAVVQSGMTLQPTAREATAAIDEAVRAALANGDEPQAGASERAPKRTFSLAADIAKADIAKPIAAAELQPVLAMREAQSVTQSAGGVSVSAPAAAIQQGGHDFAALVDRLVEARDAAMPVRAAIHHADFGQISLNFQADDTRLSVSMASADPDFAPAVQAAAAMQANSSADNGSGNQRQDTQSQQQQQQTQQNSANSASGQSQAQSQGSARDGERGRSDTSRQASGNDPARTKDEQRSEGRGGIYA